MFVYRVEHKEYKRDINKYLGPYIGQECNWMIRSHNDKNHPNCFSDTDGDYTQICGFKSIKCLTNWFNIVEIKNLYSLGFIIVRYKVKKKNVSFGKKQVMFKGHKERSVLNDFRTIY